MYFKTRPLNMLSFLYMDLMTRPLVNLLKDFTEYVDAGEDDSARIFFSTGGGHFTVIFTYCN